MIHIGLSSDDLPMFFEARHQELAARLRAAAPAIAAVEASAGQVEAARDAAAVEALAEADLFGLVAPPGSGAGGSIDVRGVCLARELLAWISPRADSIFAVQGLGAHPLREGGRHAALVAAAAVGDAVLAFALTEPDAGSDVGAIATRATRVPDGEGGGWILDGEKTLISNLGVATHAVVFATTDPGAKGATRAFVVPLGASGSHAGVEVRPMQATAPHPIGALILKHAHVGADALVSESRSGLKLALATLDTFRVTVGAAAVGMARRALAEAIAHVRARVQFGAPLATQPLVQAHLADMAVDLDAARLLVHRAAFAKDAGDSAGTEVSIAKLGATEACSRVIDRAVQLVGGRGVMAGSIVEHLYRAIRPLRIYEGTSEIQRTIIGRALAGADMIDFPADFNLADYFLFDRLGEGLEDEVALRFGARTWTYGAVADRSRALARWLVADGLAPEQRVYVVLHDVPPFAWSIFATLAAGGVLAMGNPIAPTADLEYVLAYVKARVLITTPEVARALAPAMPRLPHLRTVLLAPDAATGDDPEAPCDPDVAMGVAHVRVTSLDAAIEEGRTSRAHLPRTHRDDPAIWLFTSGSTGRPKAAMHCHRDFAWNTELYAKRTVGYRRGDVAVSVPRLFFGYATGTNLWFPFAVGGSVGLYSERPTAESLARAIELYRPTVVTNVPTMLGKLLDFDDERRARGETPLDLSCVRFHLSAGEALPAALLERFVARFGGAVYDGIGSAEMFHIYCSNRPGEVVPGSLGRAVEGYELRILPEDAIGPGAEAVPTGEIGILWVRGDSVAQGYYEDREKSWRTFHGHWCRTGDLFRLDERGHLWFAGRADDLFKVGGVFVAPLEVEECLGGHAAVSIAAVIGAPDGDDGLVKPKAFVIVRPDARARLATDDARAELAAELQDHVKARLSKHKYPRWVVFVDDLPKNDRGKVDKKTLR